MKGVEWYMYHHYHHINITTGIVALAICYTSYSHLLMWSGACAHMQEFKSLCTPSLRMDQNLLYRQFRKKFKQIRPWSGLGTQGGLHWRL